MDPNQLPPFDPNSLAYGGPGFTPLPGSHLQLQSSGPQGQQPVLSNVGFNNFFDPVASNDFNQLIQDMHSNKRASPDQFPHGANPQLYKRQMFEGQQPGAMKAMLNTTLANMPSVPACTTWSNQAPSTCAPVFPIFSHGSVQAANTPVLNSNFFNQPSLAHMLPYSPAQLQQSPGLQQDRARTEDSQHALQTQLQAALKAIEAYKGKCSQYEKALRQYTTPDPKTEKLPMQLMKEEITNLRQKCSQHENHIKELNAKCANYSKQYHFAAAMYDALHKATREFYEEHYGQAAGAPAAAPGVSPVAQNGSQSLVQSIAQSVGLSVTQSTASPITSNRDNPIDLTADDDSDTSSATVGSNGLPTAQSDNALTSFRRNLKQKDLKWLQPAHTSDAIQDVYQQLNSGDKQGKAEYGFGDCSQIVQTQQHVRQALGGPFNQPPAPPRPPSLLVPKPCKPTTPPEKKPAESPKNEPQKRCPMTDEGFEEPSRKMEEELPRGLEEQEQANSAIDTLEGLDKPTGDGLDKHGLEPYGFEYDPDAAKKIWDAFCEKEDSDGESSVSAADPGPSTEFLEDLRDKYNQWQYEQQKTDGTGTISNEELAKLLDKEWPDL